jgi:hypothetical protein
VEVDTDTNLQKRVMWAMKSEWRYSIHSLVPPILDPVRHFRVLNMSPGHESRKLELRKTRDQFEAVGATAERHTV